MRLAITADLHWGLSATGDAATTELARRASDLAPDVFVIAGDVGEGASFGRCLALFSSLGGARLVVPGNHDLWTRDPGVSSLDLYERVLPRVAGEHGFRLLDDEPYTDSGDAAILGSINWYDYSFADPALEVEFPGARAMYEAKLFPRARHNDGQFVRLPISDPEFTSYLVRRFREQLSALPPEVKQVIVVQHHPPVRELFYPTTLTTVEQRFWLAYTGNRRMQDAVLEDPRVTTVLCGHTHASCEATVAGRRCRNIGGDYNWKRLLLLDTGTREEQWYDFRRQ
jgi:predicted phosphohydrolase